MAKRTTPTSKPIAAPPPGASEQLQKLLQTTNTVDPWPVTDTLVITAPTKRRRQQMTDAQTALAVSQQLLGEAMKYVLARRPEYPVLPAAPAEGASKATYAAYRAATANYAELVTAWEQLNTEWEASVGRHQQTIAGIAARITADSEAYTRALLGGAYDEVLAYFDDLPAELWESFQTEIHYHFHLAARPPLVPEDGLCPECGQVADEEQAGKVPAPSA